jgi:signal peptidase I
MTEVKARSPWIAATLSAVASPGLGQLYNGRVLKFVAIVVGLPIAYAAVVLIAMRAGATLLLIAGAYALIVALWAATVADAYRDARRLPAAPAAWYSRWPSLAAVGLLSVFVLAPLWTVALLRSTVNAYKLPTGGMEPTILIGDHVLIDATAYGYRLPLQVTPSYRLRPASRGDIAVFRYPGNPSQHFMKRVVGLPGETVEMRNGTVHIDGQPLAEPYAVTRGDEGSNAATWGPEVVPAGHYWMLGDNRDNSKDSRYWGFLPERELIGRVVVVYLSLEQDRSGRVRGVRWSRIGHVPG